MPTITASQAASVIKADLHARNSRAVDALPPQVQALLDSHELKPLRIFNVSHHRWVDRPGANQYFAINACPAGQRHSAPTEVPFIPIYHVAIEMNRMEKRIEDSRKVALDIMGVGPFKSKDDNLTRFGVFLAAGEVPTEEELAAANAAYEKSDLALIQIADQLANEGPEGLKSITAEMRDACQRRSVVRDWAKAQKAGQACPGCGEMVNAGVKKHPVCGWRFDLGCFEGEQKAVPAPVAEAARAAGPQSGQPIRRS